MRCASLLQKVGMHPLMRNKNIMLAIVFVQLLFVPISFSWMPKEAAEWAVREFEAQEFNRSKIQFRGVDRRSSAPFITGDGFKEICNHVCEDANRCRMDPAAVKDGECVFVKTDFFEFFVREVTNRIKGRYIIVSHNGDLSAPDGQDDAPRIGMPKYVVSDILAREYQAGRLIAHHGQNLWWKNNSFSPRPEFSHCLPIGFENRQYNIGRQVHLYVEAIKRNILNRPPRDANNMKNKPLLLIAFYPKSRVPDRHKVLQILGVFPPRGQPKPKNPFYNYTDLSHVEWLDAIVEHKFVLAPFGNTFDVRDHDYRPLLLRKLLLLLLLRLIADQFNYFDTFIPFGINIIIYCYSLFIIIIIIKISYHSSIHYNY